MKLTIPELCLVVLVGPSGCGKSTTLRMVAGLEDISSGVVRIGERVVNDVPPKDRDIAMVFQNYALYPHMTVFRNLGFGLKLRGVAGAEIDRRVREAAKVLEIEHLLGRKPRELSGGQRQRVAVGRAIVREPAVFLFDEPLSNLDAKLRVTTRAELKRLHQRLRTTTIYVTHDQEEAMTLGERIVVMKDGVVQQADAPLRCYGHPVNRFVAGFIGTPPMNFFDGTLKANEGGRMVFEEGRGGGDQGQKNLSGQLTLAGNGFTLPIPPSLAKSLSGAVGRHVVLGIRPQHLRLRPAGNDHDSAPIRFRVNLIEPLGHEADVYLSTGLSERVVARLEAQAGLEVGMDMTLHADLRRVHLFEPGAAGMNLSRETAPMSPISTSESAHALA